MAISLLREITEKVRPPRSLWVPYPLGYPLGRPNDPDLQRRIVTAALELVVTATEPGVIETLGPALVTRPRLHR